MTDRVINESTKRITQTWGNGSHKGIDLGWRTDENQNKVYANCKGVVEEIQTNIPNEKGAQGVRSWGNYVLIKHGNGMYSRYAHLSNVMVTKGQPVDENTQIGVMGDSGNANGRHLHFEVQTGYNSNTRIDSTPYLTKAIYEESTIPNLKSVEEIAKEVISGKWGNGQVRKEALNNAGYNYAEIQFKVNELLGNNSSTAVQMVHTVKAGETLSSIARKYNTTWQVIYNKNKNVIGSNPNLIKPGQKLVI